MSRPTTGTPHHIEIWVPDLDRAILSWGWLLQHLGYTTFQSWTAGRSWRLGPTSIERLAAVSRKGAKKGKPEGAKG